LVEEFFIQHETIRHMLDDLRNANISGEESQGLSEKMGNSLTLLR